MKILESASKIVFIILAISASAGLFFGVVSEDNFMLLAVAAFSFYFSNKGSAKDDYLDK